MSTATTDIREIFSRIECGMAGCREAKVLKDEIKRLVYDMAYDDEKSWFQCRFCHLKQGEGHDENCPAKNIE